MKKTYYLMLLALIFLNCRQESITSENEIVTDYQKISLKTINLSQSDPIAQKASLKKLSLKNEQEISIDYNHVEYLDYGNLKTYTFKILNSDPDAPFQNIVVIEHPDGNIKTKVVTYDLSPSEKSNLLKGNGINYAGRVSSVLTDANSVSGKFEANGKCYQETVVYVQCGSGQHNANNVDQWSECTHPKKPQTYIKIEEVSCNNGGGGGTGIIGGDSGNPSEPGMMDLLTPTIPVPNNFAYVKFISTLSPVLQQTINNENNQDFYWGLNNYFYANVFNQQLKDFITWAIQFKSTNPNISWEQFENWFMGESEGKDGEDYDATYWEDPNLTFPAQNLPTLQNFKNAYPKNSSGTFEMNFADVYNLVGGTPKALRDGVLNDNDPNNDRRYDNACALRTSRALNYSGVVIPYIPGKTFKGADGKYYFLGARNLYEWMKKTFPPTPSNSIVLSGAQGGINGQNFPNLLQGHQGIYILLPVNGSDSCFGATGHAGIYTSPDLTHYYFNATCGVSSITLWILN
ncbi:T6SS effector amidase Tae4 family protein [Chryseobacterium salviniae]|uniref:T6SS effector amidase Tae4 family protein n=1 Tax=Chryseobacterium salviniae TaxID=3101750 RepID=A0ABU6HV75_9FLAO|nr:T6SS effector amidase Tae4 family protein [Chryseobacterium sp. T9W2-O]MEC3876962.1 T6SS effector amidase Tae4 family protein [Chryseobacterium sp. T9W2-O]